MSNFFKSFFLFAAIALIPSAVLAAGSEYYDHGSFPSPGSLASSAAMRAELDLIEAGFGKLPNLAGQGGRQVIINVAGTAMTSVPTDVTVESNGAVGDCVTSDATPIQNTINAVGASGGGIVKLTSSCYAIATGLVNTYNNVLLQGTGAGGFRNGNPDFDQASTVIKWTGGAGGTMYLMGPTAGAQYGVKGGGVHDIFFEGNSVAGTCIKLTTVKQTSFRVNMENCTTVGFDIATEPTLTSDPPDTQENWFEYLGISQQQATGGIGLRLNGTAAGDVSVNHFGTIFLLHDQSTGIDIGTAGGNLFDHVRIFRDGAGIGTGVLLRASAGSSVEAAHRNVFVYLQAHTGGLTSQGIPTAAFPALNNHVLNFTLANAGPSPTVERGSSLSYCTDEGTCRQASDGAPTSTFDIHRSINTNSEIGRLKFSAYDSANAAKDYGYFNGIINDNTAASEDAELRIVTKVAGADVIQAQIIDGWCIGPANGCALGTGKVNVEGASGGFYVDGMKQTGMETVTYSASMTPDLRAGHVHRITVTDGVAMTMNTPTNRDATAPGTVTTYVFRNTSGGAMGAVTFGGIHKIAGAFTTPATGFSRSITFYDDGSNLVELYRGAADVAN